MLIKKARYFYLILVGILLFNIMPVTQVHAQETDYRAYSLFVYNFMKYIEWPTETGNKEDFVIGVFGDSFILKELQNLAATKKIKGRTILVKKLSTVDEVTSCQLVYIASSKSGSLKLLLEKTKEKPILLVAEREGLAKKGAGLSFVTMEDDVLKFDINRSIIEKHNLKVSTILISLGLIVG